MIKMNVESNKDRKQPSWLDRGDDDLDVRVLQLPNRDEVSIDIQEQLVIELCSK
jgi:small subunit ribosomal protein S4